MKQINEQPLVVFGNRFHSFGKFFQSLIVPDECRRSRISFVERLRRYSRRANVTGFGLFRDPLQSVHIRLECSLFKRFIAAIVHPKVHSHGGRFELQNVAGKTMVSAARRIATNPHIPKGQFPFGKTGDCGVNLPFERVNPYREQLLFVCTGKSTMSEFANSIEGWLARAVQANASDLHLINGYPPTIRLNGILQDIPETVLDAAWLDGQLEQFCPAHFERRLNDERNLDFALALPIDGISTRFRVNLFYAAGHLGACFRIIPPQIPDFDWAGFPMELANRLASCRDGMVILTGPTGSGKSTTLAMVVNLINCAGGHRIISIEEPLEFEFPRVPHSVVSQREVGIDVPTFADGLRNGLRQDPDVILVGEIRDNESAQIALSAAETGHLVFTTLHSRDAKGAITRYTDLFPNDAQRDVRSQLALCFRAIVAQRLLPNIQPGQKCHLALEVLWNTFPIASAIRTGKFESIDNYLITSREDGLLSFDESVRKLLEAGLISRAVAEKNVRDPSFLNR
jgi:twitching motility protein PilT